MNNHYTTVETEKHVIEVSDGCLTIGTKHFPDDCVSLDPDEAEKTLHLLLAWKYGKGQGGTPSGLGLTTL